MIKLFALILGVLLAAGSAAVAQEEPEDVVVEQTDGVNTVEMTPVIVDGEELFIVRGSSALPANERAARISLDILSIAESSESKRVKMETIKGPLGFEVMAGDKLILTITEADGEFEQMETDVLASLFSDAIEEAILKYRAERTDEALVDSSIEALIWTALFALVTYLMLHFRKKFPDHVSKFVETRVSNAQGATNELVRGSAIGGLVRYALRVLILLILFILFYYYLSFVLLAFAETRPFAQLLLTYVTSPIISVLFGFLNYIPDLLTLLVIILLTKYILKGCRLFFDNLEEGTIRLRNFEHHWIWPTFNILRVIIIMIAVVISFPYLPGSDSAAFQGLTILVGVMVSLGSNSVISNMLSGLFLIYRRSMNIGDRIKVGEHIGDVVQIKLMETDIKSIKNELISIPNAQLMNSEVVNYSNKIDGRGLLLHTTVGIGYEEPQDKIEAMLIEAANRTNGLNKSPQPFVLWTALADYAINYQINGYTRRGSYMQKILSDLHRNIVDVFNENGVQIMTPSYMSDPEELKIPTEDWNGSLAGPSD